MATAELPQTWDTHSLYTLFIRSNVRIFRECLSICVCASFPFGFKGGCRIWLY